MAPPHLTKKSTITTLETTSHNGQHHKHHKRVVEELNEEDQDDEMQGLDSADANEPEASQQSSASGRGNEDVTKLINVMYETQRNHLQAQKKDAFKSYAKSTSSTEEAITTLFNDHEAQSSAAHDAQLTALRRLLAQKAKIEAAMAKKKEQLVANYLAHCTDLQLVAEHRMQGLRSTR